MDRLLYEPGKTREKFVGGINFMVSTLGGYNFSTWGAQCTPTLPRSDAPAYIHMLILLFASPFLSQYTNISHEAYTISMR